MRSERDCLEIIHAAGKMQPDLNRQRCPRCGVNLLDKQITHNALSRRAAIYVCNLCGMDEAFREMKREPLRNSDWYLCQKCETAEAHKICRCLEEPPE